MWPEPVKTKPADKPDVLVGQILDGNYRTTRFVGQGAMGTIYEATQLRLNKRVAIKVISRDLADNPLALARFRREAEVTSQLGHPHIVNVFDFGTTPSGEPYMVMEFLVGEDLEARIRRVHRMSLPAVTLIVRQVASALAATHAGGIVHRDLKPANIFLVRLEGEPEFTKVVDFGISKVHAAAVRITRGLVALGTPQFMAPEQAAGKIDEIDHRADQWALACIAFESLTGRPPFVADDPVALVYQVLHEEPPALSTLDPELPVALEPVFRRALSKAATDRYESITSFARAFETAAAVAPDRLRLSPAASASGIQVAITAEERTVLDDHPPRALYEDPPGQRRGRLKQLLGVAVTAALVLVGIWVLVGRSQPPAPAAVAPPAPPAAAPSASAPAAEPPPQAPAPRPAAVKARAAPAASTPVRPKAPRPRGKRQLIEEL
jgi:eukaryotic-like serine/threonine-protein kinase